MKNILIILFSHLVYAFSLIQNNIILDDEEHSRWAVLLAGSNGYHNYRHQADVCHAYQILKNKGIETSKLITMMYDDISNHFNNPIKGSIFNRPFSRNVYENITIDYSGEDVNPEMFFRVLSGNVTGTSKYGPKKVLNPHKNDTVFIYMVDHGSSNYFSFPDGGITSDQLIEALNNLSDKVRSVIVFIEACFSGSLFSWKGAALNSNILAFTASDDKSSSFACYWDDQTMAYLGDEFSVAWMEDVEKLNTRREALKDLFTIIKIETQGSNVCIFGNKSYLNHSVASYLGQGPLLGLSVSSLMAYKPTNILRNGVESKDVQMLTYFNRFNKTGSVTYKVKYDQLVQNHLALDHIFKGINQIFYPKAGYMGSMKNSQSYTALHFSCYRDIIKYFSIHCMNPRHADKAYSYFQIFLDLCFSEINPTEIKQNLLHLCMSPTQKD